MILEISAVYSAARLSAILIVGVRESARFNFIIVFVKLGTVFVFVILAGAFLWKNPSVAATNWSPFIPENKGHFGEFGWSGIARGAAVIFFAYIGFDAVSTTAQEARNPQRDMPIGILGSLAICTILYIAVAGLLTGILPYSHLNVAAPVAAATDVTGIPVGRSSRQGRLACGPRYRDARHADGPVANLLYDVQGWPFATVGCRHPPALQDTVGLEHHRRHRSVDICRAHSDFSPGTARKYRNAARLCNRLCRRPHPSKAQTRPGTSVQNSLVSGHTHSRNRNLSLPHGEPSARYMVEIDCLACNRFRDLFLVRPQA